MTKKINSKKVSSHMIVEVSLLVMAVLVMGAPSFAKADQLYRQLQVGSTGSDVSSLQTFLAEDPTLYPQGLVTGYFGLMTKGAVSNFQRQNEIPVVGRVGPITMAALNSQMGGNKVGTDRTEPEIGPLSIATSNSAVAINWNTSENAAAIVYYSTSPLALTEASAGTSVAISGFPFLVHTDLRSTHSANITGLQSNTVYYYSVYVRDGSGNESLTWPAAFRTN